MNTLVLAFLLYTVCSALGSLGSEVTFSPGLSRVSGGPASGGGLLQTSLSEDEELELEEDLSGSEESSYAHPDLHLRKDERRKRKSKGRRKNKQRSKNTTVFNPEHSFHTGGYTSAHTTTMDPCTSTHLGYCIHGLCKYMEDLQEPVCVCMRGFDGERCGIQTLETGRQGEEEEGSRSEVVQTVLVIIAVVLSVISCIAILLMTCAHYRSHKNFLAAYLGTGTETEKLQKPVGNIIV
ncbi:proheparin-binding EGF-like growth factor [Lampris incognitus]|uniref:proheparin-binding EGF-like growth factor n=1 Tax=Lampris incognitus TaxID=2546036 RepID=UPI0024B521CD|nr:proheparin-binding EGF-like growth factor [Lampris incognitus]